MHKPFPPIYTLTLVVLLTHVAYGGSRVLMSLYAVSLHASPFVIGTVFSIYSLAPMFVSIRAGRMGDTIGHRAPMIGGAIGMVVGLLVPVAVPGIVSLYVSATILGGAFAFFNISAQALAGAISTPQDRAFNFSTLSLGYSVASLTGPLVVGYAVEYLGAMVAYAVLAGVLLPGIAMMWLRPAAFIAKGGAGEPGARRVLDLLGNRSLLVMFVASGVCVSGWDLFSFFMPIYGTRIGLSASTIGIVISTFGVATLVARAFVPRLTRRHGELRVLEFAMYLGAAGFAFLPFSQSVPVLMALSFLIGLGLGCGQPLTMMITYARSPAGRAGEANGIRQMANNVTHMVVPLVFGALGSAIGMGPVFWMNSVLLAGGGWIGTRLSVPPGPDARL